MRKILALVLTGALAIGLVGMASAGEETQQLNTKIKPTKLSKKKPQNVQLFNEILTPDNPDLGQPPSATRTVVDWPKQFKFNNDKVAFCKTDAAGLSQATTVEQAKEMCGKKSAVSTDSGSFAVIRTNLPAPFDVVDVDVVAFNESNDQLYLYSLPKGEAATVGPSILTGKLKKFNQVNLDRPSGPYKESLDVTVPQLAAGAIANFTVTIPKSKYVQAKCKPTKMVTQATTVFSTGDVEQSSDTSEQTCKAKKGKKKKGKKGKK